jgi:hypothetical protein
MKLRIAPLAVAFGVFFATLSPAMALVHHTSPVALRTRTAAHRQAARPASHRATSSGSHAAGASASRHRPTPRTRVSVRHGGHASSHERAVPRDRAEGASSRRAAERRFTATRRVRSERSGTIAVDAVTAQHVRDDASWILQAQLPDGAIANYVDRQAIWPYLSNFAAMGLARAARVTGDDAFSRASWRWLHWYAGHEDPQGFVTDYKVVNGQPVSTGDMDSTDAYAGTFLLAARDTYVASNDLAQLRSLRQGVLGAVGAVEATQDGDGLTWAKPAWHVKYAMDQAETYGGLVAAVDVARALGDAALASRAGADATKMRNGFAKLWNPSTGSYDWAVHEDGNHQPTNWSLLYPDALQQAWVVAFGLAEASHAKTLVSHFTSAHPAWDMPAQNDLYDSGRGAVGYWAPAGWALGTVSPGPTATAAQNIRQAAMASQRAWPFTPSDSGQLILLETWNAGGTSASPPHRTPRLHRRSG